MVRIKHIKQETDWTCGPAVMRMALHALGKQVPEKKLIRLMKTTKEKGTDHDQFVEVAQKYNLPYISGAKSTTLKELKDLMKEEYVIIICYWDKKQKYGHYAIIKAIKEGRVWLADPDAHINYSYLSNYFQQIWYGTKTPHRWFIALKKRK